MGRLFLNAFIWYANTFCSAQYRSKVKPVFSDLYRGLCRDVLQGRIGSFREEFNDQINTYWWKAWAKFEGRVLTA